MNAPTMEAQLQELLDQDAGGLVKQQQDRVDQVVSAWGESFILFGAGFLGQSTLAGLRKQGIQPLAFADNNPQLWGTSIDKVKVLSPQEAACQFGHKAAFIVTICSGAPVHHQLQDLGVTELSLGALTWRYPDALSQYALGLPDEIYQEAESVKRAYATWADEDSRQEYLGQIKWRTTLDSSGLPPHLSPSQIYFPDDLVALVQNEVFVDCGAFDGDSVRELIKRQGDLFSHLFAIEPDPTNYQKLQTYVSSLPANIRDKITMLPLAVGAQRETVRFNATGTIFSSVGNGVLEVESVPLDQVLASHAPTFIKMDIEGAEQEALLGARQVVKQHLPVLAVCLYHRQAHLWQIPLLIRSLSSQYRLFLRRYSGECWESVCYAIPAWRLAG